MCVRLYEHSADPATTRLVGTLGYMVPELTVTGKAPMGIAPQDGVRAPAHRSHRQREPAALVNVVDERLDGCYDKEEARLVLLARPDVQPGEAGGVVCQYLDGDEDIPRSLTWSSCATMSVGSMHGGRSILPWLSRRPGETSRQRTDWTPRRVPRCRLGDQSANKGVASCFMLLPAACLLRQGSRGGGEDERGREVPRLLRGEG
ncbi:hypothetical protein GUJ93_ZPchr0010g7877 [Zizania palustris]|uniref:Protein kinase domain-containing protein n=1 Tax=Zizania palustris TaxID=103762 RepID=A0A8J5W1A8_ZIZPA|nr:hypothetical protein GUJ93_ZPchr0010g7877 [Zizania palustris]